MRELRAKVINFESILDCGLLGPDFESDVFGVRHDNLRIIVDLELRVDWPRLQTLDLVPIEPAFFDGAEAPRDHEVTC